MILIWLSRLFLWLGGYKVRKPEFLNHIDKAVVVAGGHTSNWDFFYALGIFHKLGMPVKFTIKHEWTKAFILGPMIRSLGGIGIDRNLAKKSGSSMVQLMVDMFQEEEELYLIVTPEGTRSPNPKWKTGFYHIAMKARVPIVLGFIDYKKREGGFDCVFEPTGDLEEDIKSVKRYYHSVNPKYPEKFVTGLEGENDQQSTES